MTEATTRGASVSGSGLCVSFAGVKALQDVDVEVGAGEVVALIGPNGSGKTTCLNVLTGFGHLDAGTVRLDGHDVTSQPVRQRVATGVGRTFQNPRLGPLGRVGDLLQAGWHLSDPRSIVRAVFRPRWTRHVDSAAQDEARVLLDRVGLAHVSLATDVAKLSHGQIKLLDVARALAGGPRVLLLDEPTSGLGPSEASHVATLLAGLSAQAISILIVEHNVGFVRRVADRITVLAEGHIVATGEPEETMGRPEVVQAYLGGVADRRVVRAPGPSAAPVSVAPPADPAL